MTNSVRLLVPALLSAGMLLNACSRAPQVQLEPTRTLAPRPSATPAPPTPAVTPRPTAAPMTGLTRDNVEKLEKLYTRREAIPRNIYTVADDRVGLFSNNLFEVFDAGTLQSIQQTPLKGRVEGSLWYALSADARVGAIMTADGQVDFYDLDAGDLMRTVKVSDVALQSTSDIALNDDGSEIVVIANLSLYRANSDDGKRIGRAVKLASDTRYVLFARDGSRVLAVRASGALDVFDTRDGAKVTLAEPIQELAELSWSPDGVRLSTSTANRVWIWDARSGESLWSLSELPTAVSVAFPPAGDLIGLYGDGSVVLYDLEKGQPVETLALSSGGAIRTAQFSADGKTLIAEGAGMLESFSVPDGKRLASLRRSAFTQISFTQDNHLLAWSDQFQNGELASLAITDGATVHSMMHKEPIRRALVGRVGKFVASSTINRAMSVWRVTDGSKVLDIPEVAGARGILCMSPDETLLAYFENGAVVVREIEGRNTRKKFKAPFENLLGLTFCDNEKGYLAFQDGNAIEVMNLEGRTVSTIEFAKPISDSAQLEISFDGRYLAGVVGGEVIVWDAETGQEILRHPVGENGGQVQFSASSDKLVVSHGRITEVLNVASGKAITLDVPATHLSTYTFPPDGRIIVTIARVLDEQEPFLSGQPNFTQGEITIWDAQTGKPLRTITLDDPVYSSALSPDGSRLAITGIDGAVSVWGIK